jgi:hypothetical protein
MHTLCRDCAYWNETDSSNTLRMGECRRHTPTGALLPGRQALNPNAMALSVHAYWPPAREDQWCGEAESKITH